MRFSEVRRAHGAKGAKKALRTAIQVHGPTLAAARSLGMTLSNFRRAVRQYGVPWPLRPAGRPLRVAKGE